MEIPTAQQLTSKRCAPCEGGVPPLSDEQAGEMLGSVEGWELSGDGKRIRRGWTARNFKAAIAFINEVAEVAEQEGHHPDLHLVGYRDVAVELTTHAIGGLSENDFILAAKIDRLPIVAKG